MNEWITATVFLGFSYPQMYMNFGGWILFSKEILTDARTISCTPNEFHLLLKCFYQLQSEMWEELHLNLKSTAILAGTTLTTQATNQEHLVNSTIIAIIFLFFLPFFLLLSRQKCFVLVIILCFFLLHNRPSNSIHATAPKPVCCHIVIYQSINHYCLTGTKVMA